ncbi:MAG: hypothetical protein D6736_01465 [Nitrospinota bacterium]|nr:MAG: hypothetical protein D6736_01465 [Nitrospinota bacterium]
MKNHSPWTLLGTCLQGLGLAFVGTVILLFFSDIGMWPLLISTLIGIVLFYTGWFLSRLPWTKRES